MVLSLDAAYGQRRTTASQSSLVLLRRGAAFGVLKPGQLGEAVVHFCQVTQRRLDLGYRTPTSYPWRVVLDNNILSLKRSPFGSGHAEFEGEGSTSVSPSAIDHRNNWHRYRTLRRYSSYPGRFTERNSSSSSNRYMIQIMLMTDTMNPESEPRARGVPRMMSTPPVYIG